MFSFSISVYIMLPFAVEAKTEKFFALTRRSKNTKFNIACLSLVNEILIKKQRET